MTWPDSPHGGTLGDGRFASFTDRPESLDALRQAVVARVEQGWAIYPQGGGTALDYGGIPRVPGVAIDTRALDRVIDYPAADMTITVEAGITMAALRSVLAEEQQRLLVDAPQADRATLGGVYATNTSGPRRFGAGRPRDQIIGVSFVTSDGALVKGGGRVVKNVAGYDFPKLLTGSLGTLGILTQLTLKVRPIPEASALAWATFAKPDDLAGVLERLNTSATRPMAIELLNQAAAQRVAGGSGLPVARLGPGDRLRGQRRVGRLASRSAPFRAGLGRGRGPRGGRRRAALDGPDRVPAAAEVGIGSVGPVSFTASLRPSSVVAFVKDVDPGAGPSRRTPATASSADTPSGPSTAMGSARSSTDSAPGPTVMAAT